VPRWVNNILLLAPFPSIFFCYEGTDNEQVSLVQPCSAWSKTMTW
jgi:hypothetical protein